MIVRKTGDLCHLEKCKYEERCYVYPTIGRRLEILSYELAGENPPYVLSLRRPSDGETTLITFYNIPNGKKAFHRIVNKKNFIEVNFTYGTNSMLNKVEYL